MVSAYLAVGDSFAGFTPYWGADRDLQFAPDVSNRGIVIQAGWLFPTYSDK